MVSFIATVGNYECVVHNHAPPKMCGGVACHDFVYHDSRYAFYWKFSRDGAFQLDVKLTGIIHTDTKHALNEK